jgi:antitoxin (DNA-binding transcriptional repressor) of toxin-antitoxin stability system
LIVDVHEAETRLSELIAAAKRDEEVLIARNGVPPARRRGDGTFTISGRASSTTLPRRSVRMVMR